jgi:hypothetical protein
MAPPPTPSLDTVITIALAAADVAPTALAMVITTLQATATASRERAMGAITAAGAPIVTAVGATAATRSHPPASPPFVAASASAPAVPYWCFLAIE